MVGGVPIVCTLDLHGVLTDKMCTYADVFVPYHTYPHTDHNSTGVRAAHATLSLLEGTTVVGHRIYLPLLVRGDELLTATGRFGEAVGSCRELEAETAVLAAGILIGNPATDVPELGTKAFAYSRDRNRYEATRRIASFMWEHRGLLQATLTPIQEAVAAARSTEGLVVLSDGADATSSGASGDSNAILSECLRSAPELAIALTVVDPPAAAAAHAAARAASWISVWKEH